MQIVNDIPIDKGESWRSHWERQYRLFVDEDGIWGFLHFWDKVLEIDLMSDWWKSNSEDRQGAYMAWYSLIQDESIRVVLLKSFVPDKKGLDETLPKHLQNKLDFLINTTPIYDSRKVKQC